MEEILDNQAVEILTAVVTIAAALVAALPQGKTGGALDRVRTVVNWLALNVGNAKNARTK